MGFFSVGIIPLLLQHYKKDIEKLFFSLRLQDHERLQKTREREPGLGTRRDFEMSQFGEEVRGFS